MVNSEFFVESKEQSRIKSEIVSKYLWAWSKAIIPTAKKKNGKVAYIDLFAGPGRYHDGTKSTPLLVLEKAINDPDMRNMLVTIFSDADPEKTQLLKNDIDNLTGINTLKYKPIVDTSIVNDKVAETFHSIQLIPTLSFFDPWGYKGLSRQLVNSFIKDWGCDCIIFFNYNRINMGIMNDKVTEHMEAILGEENVRKLRLEIGHMNTSQRESAILTCLSSAMMQLGGKYVLPFRFRSERGKRISHHLVFISKNQMGYQIMKDIMASVSTSECQGVPSFEYSPFKETQLKLAMPLDELKTKLLDHFAGKCLTVYEIFNKHNINTNYILRNYKEALIHLEDNGKISAEPPFGKRVKRGGKITMADSVKIMFPNRERKQ
jgi:three-Cys-motif partner protein